jgi:PAS domain S-box-containing protein
MADAPAARPDATDLAGVIGAVLNASPGAMLAVDAAGRIVAANDSAHTLFGAPRGALVGVEIEALVPPGARATHRVQRSAYERAPRPRPMRTGLDLYGVRFDGTEFPVDVSLQPVNSEGGPFVVAAVRERPADHADASDDWDKIMQSLFGVAMSLRAIESRPDEAVKVKETVSRALDRLHSIIEAIRDFRQPDSGR